MGITLKIRMLCFVLISNVLLNLLCLFVSCFRSVSICVSCMLFVFLYHCVLFSLLPASCRVCIMLRFDSLLSCVDRHCLFSFNSLPTSCCVLHPVLCRRCMLLLTCLRRVVFWPPCRCLALTLWTQQQQQQQKQNYNNNNFNGALTCALSLLTPPPSPPVPLPAPHPHVRFQCRRVVLPFHARSRSEYSFSWSTHATDHPSPFILLPFSAARLTIQYNFIVSV